MDLLGARVVIGLEDCQEKNLQPHALTKELTRLRAEKDSLKIELEKEKAVSAKLQEILYSLASESKATTLSQFKESPFSREKTG